MPITEEEKIKRPDVIPAEEYTYQSPQGTYYGEQGNDQSEMYRQLISDYAARTDPRRQAEEDARTQKGRAFWTGANLFANVVANAINANGTAKGAPNMTWNDAASQKMYGTWRTADQQLKADRREAQRRFETLQMQDAQMRSEGAAKRAAERQRANDMNFNIALEEARHERALQEKEADRGYAEQLADRKRQQDLEDYEKKLQMQARYRPRTTGRSGGSGLKDSGGHSVSVGSVDIPAKDKKEAERIRKNVADKIVDKLNKDIEERNKGKKVTEEKEKPISKPKSDKEAQEILYQYGGLYDDDAEFRDGINSTYGIEDIYAEEAVPEFEQFGGRSVRPDESSLPDPRRYAGTTPNQTPRAYRGNPVTWNTSPIRQTPHALSEGEKELLKKGGKKPKIEY